MPLKLTCPSCGHPTRVSEPYPLPGAEVQCTGCATPMSVSYPTGVMQQLRDRGKLFEGERTPLPVSSIPDPAKTPGNVDREATPEPMFGGDSAAPTEVEAPRARQADLSALPAAPPPPAPRTRPDTTGPLSPPPRPAPPKVSTSPKARPPSQGSAPPKASEPPKPPRAGKPGKPSRKPSRKPSEATTAAVPRRGGVGRWVRRLGLAAVALTLLGGAGGAAVVGGAYYYYSQELPSVDLLETYRPPTVTEVYDNNGTLMGELYEQRRYVVEPEAIPERVRNAFLAAEDAGFYEHGGVDYIGLVRAVLNEVTGGDKRQGASTITMQVTRNFLLTRDKTYERKIKEIILAQRIESVYDKDRILWLYLNELYLGSGAYGVEAASRVYFGKHVDELSIAEAALIAGLAPAPSKYSPHMSYDKARTRQLYVLDQMLKNGHITDAEYAAAKDEHIRIVKEDNPFLITAPHFTEHVRRYLMDTYGFERVYNEGLVVTTTMDLSLQTNAQRAVAKQVHRVDQRMGFRRKGVQTLATDADIHKKRAEHEAAMKERNSFEADPAGRVPTPATSELHPGRVYDAVVLESQPKWVRVGIGEHEAIIPLPWSTWVYEPNPRMSWRARTNSDFTAEVRGWEDDVEPGGALIRKGDVVLVKVEALSTLEPTGMARDDDDEPLDAEAVAKAFRNTPGADKDFVAARLWQAPEVEAATMTFDLETGAVRAMVGGADFEKSEFNRATQAKRQVGSTFKPIVYGAAIDTKRMTAASIVPDVAGASYATDAGFVWKPDNYGDEYLGNITLRKALALSKNTCTIKVLESMDPGMNDDVLYTFARKLGIGGPPTYQLPEQHVTLPENDHLCPWVRETPESTICMDRYPPKDPDISNTKHRQQMGPDDVYMCRACDMSMGLGSASLTMEELLRAYSTFGTGGKLVQPYYIEKVVDRDGNVLEQHKAEPFPQVIRPEVASIVSWLLQNVVNGGTGSPARAALGVRLAGKTGTTQDYKDTWFVGFSNDVITAAWVGFDEPRSLGVSSTGGRTALPIWIDVMREAAPKEKDRPFPVWGDVEWASIDEDKGTRVTSGGRSYPFIGGTAPASSGVAAGEYTVDDFTEL